MKPKLNVEARMTEFPCIARPTMSVTEAVEMMKENRIRHLPVVDRGKVVGVISDRDLKQAELLSDSMQIVVSDFMSRDPYCVEVGTSLLEIATKMAEKKYGCAVVMNQVGRVVGIFTTTDGMRVLAEILSKEPNHRSAGRYIEELLDISYLV